MIFLKKTCGEWAHANEPLMFLVVISVDENDEEVIIYPLAEMLMYIFFNGLENEPNNNLLLTNEKLSSNDKEIITIR